MNINTAKLGLLALLGSTLCISAAQAQSKDIVLTDSIKGYAVDQRGVVVRSGFGLCWRTNSWTPAMAISECDPDLVKKEEPKRVAVAKPVETKPAAPVAPPPAAKKCDFSATLTSDETFTFNKAVLTLAAKAKLDKEVVGKLGTCAAVRLVMITGHTDRLGSAQYNQKLSEKRADAVKGYLVGKGVDAKVTETMGAGKTQPAQGVPKCADNLPRKKMIECLAPNRRVVVEVKGPAK